MNKVAIAKIFPLGRQKLMIRVSRNQSARFFFSLLYMYLHGLCSAIPQKQHWAGWKMFCHNLFRL